MDIFKRFLSKKPKDKETPKKLIDVENLDMLDNFKPKYNSKFKTILFVIFVGGFSVWYIKFPEVLQFKTLVTDYAITPLNKGIKVTFDSSKDYVVNFISKNPTKTEPLKIEDKKVNDVKNIINQMKEKDKDQFIPINQVQVAPVAPTTTAPVANNILDNKNKEILNNLNKPNEQVIAKSPTIQNQINQVHDNVDIQALKLELKNNAELLKSLATEQENINKKINTNNTNNFKKEDIENLIYVNNQELSKVLNEKIIPIIKVMNDDMIELKKINSKKDTQIKVLKKMLNLNSINDESMYDKSALLNNDIGLDYYGAKLVNEKNGNLIVMGFITKQDKTKIFEVFINAEIENTKIGDIKIIDITDSYIYVQSKSNNQIYKIKKV